MKPAVAVFVKAPEPGYAKTRPIPVLGPEGAATLREPDGVDGAVDLRSIRVAFTATAANEPAYPARAAVRAWLDQLHSLPLYGDTA